MKRVQARFFRTRQGREPVRDWLLELAAADRKRVGEEIKDVEFSWPIGMPLCRHLGDGLWEVRCSLSARRIARVLFCLRGDTMLLLHAFMKTTQKTPQHDLELARTRLKEFLQ